MKKLALEALNRLEVEDYRALEKHPIRLVLDNIRSGLNVGSAFRTADAFALDGVSLCGISAQPPHREILKTAIGATESVQWTYHQDVLEAVRSLKNDGWTIILVEQTDESIPLPEFRIQPDARYVLVFGNEVKGVSEALLEEADLALEIPQFGTKHSLNISVCVGILSWELIRQRLLLNG